MKLVETGKHRNSLGYVIVKRDDVTGGGDEATIVWGIKPDGTRLFIDEARRGGADRLRCECGADLIARQGEIRAHHFAHASGAARSCKDAHLNALGKFAANVLEGAREIRLPRLRNMPATTELSEAVPEVFGSFAGARISRRSGDDRRELCIVLMVKRPAARLQRDFFASRGISAMVIDLMPFRNRPDDQIERAIRTEASRSWLCNIRHPDLEALTELRTDPVALGADCSAWRGIGKVEVKQVRSPSSKPTGPEVIIDGAGKQVDRDDLTRAELRRVLFGDDFDQ